MNKQDRYDPLYRSRLVDKDYHNSIEPHLYTVTPHLKFLCELPGQMWKAVGNYGQRCQACLFLRAKFDAHVRPDQSREISSRETNTDAASCLCQCVARGQPQEIGRGATKKFSRQMESPHLHLLCECFITQLEGLWCSCTVTISRALVTEKSSGGWSELLRDNSRSIPKPYGTTSTTARKLEFCIE